MEQKRLANEDFRLTLPRLIGGEWRAMRNALIDAWPAPDGAALRAAGVTFDHASDVEQAERRDHHQQHRAHARTEPTGELQRKRQRQQRQRADLKYAAEFAHDRRLSTERMKRVNRGL